jgi:very-short-patch-repair endonuclease
VSARRTAPRGRSRVARAVKGSATILDVNWSPSAQEIQEKLIEMAYTWGDIEKELAEEPGGEAAFNSAMIETPFRIEAIYDENGLGDPCVFYVLLFDVADDGARENARLLEQHGSLLDEVIKRHARPWHSTDYLSIKQVPRSTPVEGEICRRLGEKHPTKAAAALEDVPVNYSAGEVGLIEKDGYFLTPIEVPFYNALRETGLTFAVQPWIQGTDRRYRVDFLVFHDGRAVAVELDGHDWHKTKEQRGKDAERDRWFKARKIETLRWTGSQVFADAQACVVELQDVLRAAPAKG